MVKISLKLICNKQMLKIWNSQLLYNVHRGGVYYDILKMVHLHRNGPFEVVNSFLNNLSAVIR